MSTGDIRVQIVRRLGEIKKLNNGWARELNIVSWNGAEPKYDIREWSPDHERMSRGITLTEVEISSLVSLYVNHKVNEGYEPFGKEEDVNEL